MNIKAASLAALSLAMGATSVSAGALERAVPSTRVLFEEGNYVEFSIGGATPQLGGQGGLLAPGGAFTGDLLDSFITLGAALKVDLNDRVSFALIFDNPWGVDTEYPLSAGSLYTVNPSFPNTTIPIPGPDGDPLLLRTEANLDSGAVTGIVAVDIGKGFKAYAGLRGQTIEAQAQFPFGSGIGLAGPYTITAENDTGFGWMAGASYERPEIALRVALTYYSQIAHSHATTETVGLAGLGGVAIPTTTTLQTPQAVNLEFQTGVAKDTLVFGSVRWVDWSSFSIAPPVFTAGVGAPLVDFGGDYTTINLGLGRKFTDVWSGAITATAEPPNNTTLTTLGPVDGRYGFGLAATYTQPRYKVTGGINYSFLGETENFAGTNFSGGNAIAAGVRFGFNF